MQINVTFRRLDPSDALREYAENRLQKLKKYADGPMDVNVVLSVEKFRQTAEVVLSGDGIRAAAKEEQNEMRAAIDLVSDKIYRQLRRNSKRGLGYNHHKKNGRQTHGC
jgi:putative sigma-54 modulation protein